MTWFYLALAATILYAVVNLLDDNLLAFVYKTPYLSCVSVGFFGVLPLLSRVFFRASSIPMSLALLALLAGFLTLCYYFFYFKGLQSDTPAVVVALFSLAPATIPFLAYFVVHERLVALQVVGFAVVLLTSLGLAIQEVRSFKFSRALVFVVIGALIMDVIAITSKYVYEHVDFYPAYLYYSAGMGLGGVFFFALRYSENISAIKTIAVKIKLLLPVFVLTEAIGLAAEFLLNLAISRGSVSIVKAVEASQPMFVLILALVLYPFSPKYFREAASGRLTRKFVLMVIMVVGLVIISVASGNPA